MHDVFYTKAAVVYSFCGGVLRFVSFSCIVSVFATFLLSQGNQSYKTIDVIITYVLLAGAIGLEIYSDLLLLVSDWTMPSLSKHRNIAAHLFFKANSLFAPSENKRWSNSIAQYNLVSFCLKDEPARYHYCRFFKRVPCIYRLTEKYLYKSTLRVPKELKVLIFEQLLKKSTSDFSNREKLCAQRGRWVLDKEKCDLEWVGWSIEDAEFDRNILLWHIATDLCYHIDLDEDSTSVRSPNAKENSKLLSEYMLYLLVTHPFMLPHGIGQIRFQDTRAGAMEFFEERKSITDTKKACEALLDVSTEIPPSEVKGHRSKSVLFNACALANDLQSLEEKQKLGQGKEVGTDNACVGGDVIICSKPMPKKSARSAAEARWRAAHSCLASHGSSWCHWTVSNFQRPELSN